MERADKLAEPGMITNQIIDRVTGSDLVIADLSERNPNVFYELAIRHVTRKPYIHLIAHDEDIPFDNAGARAIKVDVSDLRSVAGAKVELARQITTITAPGAVVESPISIALSMQEMRSSGDEEKIVLSTLSQQMSEMRKSVSDLTSLVASQPSFRNRPRNAFIDLGDPSSNISNELRNALLGRHFQGIDTTNLSAAAASASAAASRITDGIAGTNRYTDTVANRPVAVTEAKKGKK